MSNSLGHVSLVLVLALTPMAVQAAPVIQRSEVRSVSGQPLGDSDHSDEAHPVALPGGRRFVLRVYVENATHPIRIQYTSNDVGAVNADHDFKVADASYVDVFLDTNFIPWTVPVTVTVSTEDESRPLYLNVESPAYH